MARRVRDDNRSAEACGAAAPGLAASALDAAGIGAWQFDPGTGRVAWSAVCGRLHDLPPGRTDGERDDFLATVHPEDRAAVAAAIDGAAEHGPFSAEYRVRRDDGRWHWRSASGSAERAETAAVRVAGVVVDIDGRKREEWRDRLAARVAAALGTEGDLRQRAAATARVLVPELAAWGAVDLRLPEGPIVRLAVVHGDPARAGDVAALSGDDAPVAVEALGVVPEVVRAGEARLRPAAEAARDDDPRHAALRDALGSGDEMVVPLAVGGATIGALTLVAAPGQGFGDCCLAAARDVADRCAGALENALVLEEARRDLAGRLAAEDALRRSEDRLRLGIASLPVTLFQQDRDLRFTWSSLAPDGVDLATVGPDDALLDGGDAALVAEAKRRVLATGEPSRLEVAVRVPGHGRHVYDLVMEAMSGPDGAPDGLIGAAIDVTDRRLREERIGFLQQLTADLARAATTREVVAAVSRYGRDRLGAERVTVAVLNGRRDGLRRLPTLSRGALRRQPAIPLASDHPLAEAVRTGEPVVRADPGPDGRERVTIAVPLVADGETAGGLKVIFPPGARGDAEEVTFIRTVGNLCAQSLARASLFDREHDARARLEALETRFRATFEQAAVGMAHLWPDGRWMRVNPRLCELLGRTREELLLQSLSSITHPDDRAVCGRLHRELVDGAVDTCVHEQRFVRGDGGSVWVSVTMAVVRDALGRAAYTIGVFEDVTERKAGDEERERLLREVEAERARLETVLRQLPVGVLIADAADGDVLMANARLRAALGDAAGPPLAGPQPGGVEALHDDGSAFLPEEYPLARAVAGEVVVGEEFAIRRADGTEAAVRVGAAPVRDREERVVAGVLTVEEITAERRAQEAERLLAAVGDLLAARLDDRTLARLARLPLPRLADACLVEVEQLDGACALTVAAADAAAEAAIRACHSACVLRGREGHPFSARLRANAPVLVPAATADAASRAWLGDDPPASLLVVPLLTRGELFGLMTFLRDDPATPFDETDAALAHELGRRAAAALDIDRLYADEQTARRNAEAASGRIGRLQRLTAALAEALTVEQVARIVVSEGIAAVGARCGTLGLLAADGASVEIVGAAGRELAGSAPQDRFPLDAATPYAEAVRSGEPRLLGTAAEAVARYPALRDRVGDRRQAFAAVPLLIEGRSLGAIALNFGEERDFTSEEGDFLLALGRQSALAIERARLYAAERNARTDAEAARSRLAFLAEASVALAASLDYATTLRRVAEWVVPSLADWCTIHILREDGEVENLVVAHADPGKMEWARGLQQRLRVDLERRTGIAEVLRTGVPKLLDSVTAETLVGGDACRETGEALQGLDLSSAMVVPLVAQGETLGALALVADESGRHYGEEDLRFAEDLARRAAAAVSNARHYLAEELARREAERANVGKTRLQAITAALAEATTPEDVARVLATDGARALGAVSGVVVLRQEDGTFRIARAEGYDPDVVRRWEMFHPRAEQPLAEALRDQRPVVVGSLAELRERYPRLHAALGDRARPGMVAIPILYEGRALGALGLGFDREVALEEDDAALVTALARQSAVALERARLWQAERQARAQAQAAERLARRETDRIAALADLSRAIAEAELDLPAALDAAARITADQVGDCAVIRLVSDDGEWMDVTAVAHPDAARLAAFAALIGPRRHVGDGSMSAGVLESGEPMLFADDGDAAPAHRARWREFAAAGVGGVLVVPLRARGRRIGTLGLLREERNGPYAADEVPFVQELADRAALAIDNARLYREARDAVRDRDEFLSVAAHELRTPVTTVKGYAQLLRRAQDRDGFASDRARQFIDAIDGASDRLRLLTDDLLDVSRLRLGKLPLRMRPVEPAALVAAAARRSREQLGDAHPVTTAIAPGAAGRTVEADPDRIDQILSNLLDNAAKYSPDGAPIHVAVAPEDGGVLVSVRDEGIGLPPHELELVFEPFRRASNAERANLPGLGLGLAICQSIAERHGGRIWAESAGEGRGTTLRLWLPAEGAGAGHETEAEVRERAAEAPAAG